jgi:hypothetical protein
MATARFARGVSNAASPVQGPLHPPLHDLLRLHFPLP